jgi:hypothetical protein
VCFLFLVRVASYNFGPGLTSGALKVLALSRSGLNKHFDVRFPLSSVGDRSRLPKSLSRRAEGSGLGDYWCYDIGRTVCIDLGTERREGERFEIQDQPRLRWLVLGL